MSRRRCGKEGSDTVVRCEAAAIAASAGAVRRWPEVSAVGVGRRVTGRIGARRWRVDRRRLAIDPAPAAS